MTSPSHPSSPADLLRSVLTLAAIVGTIAVNAWTNIEPIGGQNIGEIANTVFADVLIIPASYAFAIWGVIYLGLVAFGIWQLLPAQRTNPTIRKVDYLVIFASIAQAIWVFLFLLREFWGSVVAMLAILLSLIAIYRLLGIGLRRISRQEKWFAHIPFSIYLGWISVATIVNVASALFYNNWDGWGLAPEIWTVLVMSIATAIGAILTLQRRELAYPLVIVWALVAVAIRQSDFAIVSITAIVLAIGLAILTLVNHLGWGRKRPWVE
ncbi:tryptophan-rich sensory protein [Egbenema bharatensis]|uniref:tryptophan-rich sensory protein n=1 Tax=Egbenema bharatensis TaxID=3463334 RepID=UPI003A8509CE